MDHSYEEIRKAVIDILAGKEKSTYKSEQYQHLRTGVAEVLQKGDGTPQDLKHQGAHLSHNDNDLFQEIFWDLFRQNIITLGNRADPNVAYPFYHVSNFGKKMLDNENFYFFHDLTSYESNIMENIPGIEDLTLLYVKEAMQAFTSGCRLSSTAMLGIALEYSLNTLYDSIGKNDKYSWHFHTVLTQPTMLKKFTRFKQKLTEKKQDLPEQLKDDLDVNFDMITSLIRNYRNESGRPNEKVLSREQCYVNLQLFIPSCKKIYVLMEFFGQ